MPSKYTPRPKTHRPNFVDLTDQRFGRWLVLSWSHTTSQCSYWLCRCAAVTVAQSES
jgi:hypothetical protein